MPMPVLRMLNICLSAAVKGVSFQKSVRIVAFSLENCSLLAVIPSRMAFM
jgi:hypothetical protein